MSDDNEHDEFERKMKRMQDESMQQTKDLMEGMLSKVGGVLAAMQSRQEESQAWTGFATAFIHRGHSVAKAAKMADKMLEERRNRFLAEDVVAAVLHGGKDKK